MKRVILKGHQIVYQNLRQFIGNNTHNKSCQLKLNLNEIDFHVNCYAIFDASFSTQLCVSNIIQMKKDKQNNK